MSGPHIVPLPDQALKNITYVNLLDFSSFIGLCSRIQLFGKPHFESDGAVSGESLGSESLQG